MSEDISNMLDSFPEGWRPEPGDKLIGTVIGLESRIAEYGEYPIVIVRTEDGEDLAFHAFHTVARRELEEQRPKLGDRIGIAYHGRHSTKGYARYKIKVIRRTDDSPDEGAAPNPGAGPNNTPEDIVPSDDTPTTERTGESAGGGDGIPF